MKIVSISDIREEIRNNSCRYFKADLVSSISTKFIFVIGRYNEFSGFVPEYQTRPISFGSKTLLVALARCHGLIGCNF